MLLLCKQYNLSIFDQVEMKFSLIAVLFLIGQSRFPPQGFLHQKHKSQLSSALIIKQTDHAHTVTNLFFELKQLISAHWCHCTYAFHVRPFLAYPICHFSQKAST